MSTGISHITFIVTDLDRTQEILERILDARCVYSSGPEQFSISEERFFLIGDTWIATMKGDPLPGRTYNHIAFQVAENDMDRRRAEIAALGLELRPERSRVPGEGQSIYFYGPDKHLFELHTGTLADRLARYAKGKESAK
jgi:catechol 2,3-dioxygenase-like lactoylglutathione lyase family enzyme